MVSQDNQKERVKKKRRKRKAKRERDRFEPRNERQKLGVSPGDISRLKLSRPTDACSIIVCVARMVQQRAVQLRPGVALVNSGSSALRGR